MKNLKKQTFVEAINAIEKQQKENIIFAENMAKCFPNTNSSDFMGDTDFVTTALITVLKELYDIRNNWIEYFCWELDFGRENWRLKAYDENKKEIPFSTAEELFEFLSSR